MMPTRYLVMLMTTLVHSHKMMSTLYLVMLMATLVHSNRKDKEKVKKHYEQVNTFRCFHPQPRVISLEDLQLTHPSMIYIPDATVLYRCDYGTGTCPKYDEVGCQSIEQENITLEFKQHNGFENKTDTIAVTTFNHTKCGCNSTDPPKINSFGKKINFNEHLEIVENFSNLAPAPRLIPIVDLNLNRSDILYYPHAAMINQCVFDMTYCKSLNGGSNKYCRSKCFEEEDVILYFKEINKDHLHRISIINVTTKQHKKCGCTKQNNDPNKSTAKPEEQNSVYSQEEEDSVVTENQQNSGTEVNDRFNRAQFKSSSIYLLILESCFIIAVFQRNS